MRRIEAARLLRDAPEVSEKVRSGHLNLSQLALVQKVSRERLKETGQTIPIEQKREILAKISGATQAQTEVVLRAEFEIKLPEVISKPIYHRDESVTLTIKLSKEQMDLCEKARNLLSHAVPDGSWANILGHLCSKEIQKRTISTGTSAGALKKQLLHKEARCQFVDSTSGEKCKSALRLELDHIKPRWAGGNDSAENITILCAQHNRHRYRLQAGQITA